MREPGRATEHHYTLEAARQAGYRALERLDAEMALAPEAARPRPDDAARPSSSWGHRDRMPDPDRRVDPA